MNDSLTTDDTGRALNENQLRFIDEYFATVPYNATAAYARVYVGVSDKVAGVNSTRLMADPRIQAEIKKRQEVTREKFKFEAEDVLREVFLVASADPRELSENRIGACRYCHGDGFKFQRTPAEFQRDIDSHIKERSFDKVRGPDPLGMEFDMLGGVGFNSNKPPHAECPECFGNGVSYRIFKDTRTLSKAAARLYSGVKETRDGFEIKTRSQDKMVELAGQALGIFKQVREHSGPGGGPIMTADVVLTEEQRAMLSRVIDEQY